MFPFVLGRCIPAQKAPGLTPPEQEGSDHPHRKTKTNQNNKTNNRLLPSPFLPQQHGRAELQVAIHGLSPSILLRCLAERQGSPPRCLGEGFQCDEVCQKLLPSSKGSRCLIMAFGLLIASFKKPIPRRQCPSFLSEGRLQPRGVPRGWFLGAAAHVHSTEQGIFPGSSSPCTNLFQESFMKDATNPPGGIQLAASVWWEDQRGAETETPGAFSFPGGFGVCFGITSQFLPP